MGQARQTMDARDGTGSSTPSASRCRKVCGVLYPRPVGDFPSGFRRDDRAAALAGDQASRLQPPPDRKSGVQGKSVSVRVDLGGRRLIKKKKKKVKKTST